MKTIHLDWHGFGKVIQDAGDGEPLPVIQHAIGYRLHEPHDWTGLGGNEECFTVATLAFRRGPKDDLHEYNYYCAGCVQCQPMRVRDILTTIVREATTQAVRDVATAARDRARELAHLRAASLSPKRRRAIAKKAAAARWKR